MMENILNMVTINSSPESNTDSYFLDYSRHFPFRLRDALLPSDSTGYVYCLHSLRNPDFTYIGQTENIRQRLREHNSGHGARDTCRFEDAPFAVAGYISGLVGYSKSHRMSLEAKWRRYRNRLSDDNVMNILDQGDRIVREENIYKESAGYPERINFVKMYND